MGDLRNKAKKWAEEDRHRDIEDRRRNGFTVFHFDFNPKLTCRDLKLGEAIRYLMRVTGTRVSFWRCPVRGLAVQYRKLPHTRYAYDHGESYMFLHFSDLDDVTAAKKALVLDVLLRGIELYRGLPNRLFDQEVATIKWLLTAPPSVGSDDWLKSLETLQKPSKTVIRTHEAELRFHLLGERYQGPTGPVALSVAVRLEAKDRQSSSRLRLSRCSD